MSDGYGVYGCDISGAVAGLVYLGAVLGDLEEFCIARDVFLGELVAEGLGDVVEVIGGEGEDGGAGA